MGAAVVGEEFADRARAALKIQSVVRGQAKRAEYVRDKAARRQWVARYIAVSMRMQRNPVEVVWSHPRKRLRLRPGR